MPAGIVQHSVISDSKRHVPKSHAITAHTAAGAADRNKVLVTDPTTGSIAYYAPDSMVTVRRGATDVLSAQALRDAVTAASALTPGGNARATDNRVVVMIPAGRYDFGIGDIADANHGLELDAEFVDLVGMTGKREDVILTSAITIASRGTVEQTADDVKISFLTMEITSASTTGSSETVSSAYFPLTALAAAVLTDVECKATNDGAVYTMRQSVDYAGTYTDCLGGLYAFGGYGGASGDFLRCTAGDESFGASAAASGNFTDCTGGLLSFGAGFGGTAGGDFLRCTGGNNAFGGDGSTADGNYTDCTGGDYAFGGNGGTASGTFIRCTGGNLSFGGFGGTVDVGAVFLRCNGAATHMNTGKTRACYTAAWATIDNE